MRISNPFSSISHRDSLLRLTPLCFSRVRRLLATGEVFGWIMLVIFSVQHLFFYVLEWAFPREEIDYVPVEARWERGRMERVSSRGCFSS